MITTKQQIKVASEWTVKSLFRSYNFAGNDDGAVKVKVTGIFNLIINHPRTHHSLMLFCVCRIMWWHFVRSAIQSVCHQSYETIGSEIRIQLP